MKWLAAIIFPVCLLLACVVFAQERTSFGGGVAVQTPSNYSVRVHLTFLNLSAGAYEIIPMEAVDNDHQTWDPDSWLDNANDEIDLPGPGVYEYVLSVNNSSLQQRHATRYMRHRVQVGDGAITNAADVDNNGNIMASSAHGSRSGSWRGVFEATNTTPFVYVETRGFFGGGRNFQEGFLFINRKSDTTP